MSERKTRSIFCIAVFLSVFVVATVTYHIGHRRGALSEQVKRIPFDLEWYLQLYEMGTYINAADESAPTPEFREGNALVLLYGTLHMYDANREKFPELGKESPRFEENVKKARQIVADVELVSVESVIESVKQKSQEEGNNRNVLRGSSPSNNKQHENPR